MMPEEHLPSKKSVRTRTEILRRGRRVSLAHIDAVVVRRVVPFVLDEGTRAAVDQLMVRVAAREGAAWILG